MLFNILLNGSESFLVNFLLIVFILGGLVIALTLHEFAHAFVADRLGDPTARSLGRLTLNPLSHLDTTGTVFLLFTGFGWGKPVPFDPRFLKNPRRDSALIAFAGPMSNILGAILLAVLFNLLPNSGSFLVFILTTFLRVLIQYNLVLAIFNLIPVEPLDGFKIVAGVLPSNLVFDWMQMRQYGIWILLILVFTGTTEKIMIPFLTLATRILGL